MIPILPKLPNILIFTLLFITTFLLSFLLLSCYETPNAYSAMYLTSFKFNDDEMLVVSFNDTTSSDELAAFSIDVGYLSFCVNYVNDTTCSTFGNIDKLAYYPLIRVDSGNNDTTIDLVQLSKKFNDICYSYILMATLIIVLLCLTIMIWIFVPLLPGKNVARKVICSLSLANVLLWGVGAMLQHEAVKSAILIELSSMNLIKVTTGLRAEIVTWTAFAFLSVIFIGNLFVMIRCNLINKKISESKKSLF